MSVDKWYYHPDICDGNICPGDCDLCNIPKNPELYELDEETEEEIEREILAARKGEE